MGVRVTVMVFALLVGLPAASAFLVRNFLAVRGQPKFVGASEQSDPNEIFSAARQEFHETYNSLWQSRGNFSASEDISISVLKYYDERDYGLRRPVGITLFIHSVPENRLVLFRPFRFNGNYRSAAHAAAALAIETIAAESEGVK